jgi:hypothetical protein
MTVGDLLVVALAFLVLIGILRHRSLSPRIRELLAIGLGLRVVGGLAYYFIGEAVYGGTADHWTYFWHGEFYAKALLAGTPEESGSYWLGEGHWCCTAFTIKVTGIVIAALNTSIFGCFVLFGLIGYFGVVAFAVAFWRAFPTVPAHRYLQWLMLFPSLWYWPAALGKDALVIAGFGLATVGFVGKGKHPSWLPLIAGTALVFAVRPQVAVVLLCSIAVGHWVFLMTRGTAAHLLQGILVALLGLGALLLAESTLNVSFRSSGEVSDYLAGKQSTGSRLGGSTVEASEESRTNPVMGAINVLFRPFLWEVRSLTALIAGLEIVGVWALALLHRRRIASFVRANYGDRVFWMATFFILAYAAGLGMGVGNLGVIARQRVHLFPFIFMFFAGSPRLQQTNSRPAVHTPTAGWPL